MLIVPWKLYRSNPPTASSFISRERLPFAIKFISIARNGKLVLPLEKPSSEAVLHAYTSICAVHMVVTEPCNIFATLNSDAMRFTQMHSLFLEYPIKNLRWIIMPHWSKLSRILMQWWLAKRNGNCSCFYEVFKLEWYFGNHVRII
jgi:hypothetical protein